MGQDIQTIGVVLTCHNRKDKTLKCLGQLYAQDDISNINLSVYLVDDGSTDGTGDAVRKKYPQINVIQGDGTLFWNGGMRVAFAKARENNHDFYLWLNDDTFLYNEALHKLIETSLKFEKGGKDIIVAGTIKDDNTGKVNYGGRLQKDRLHPLTFLLVKESNEPQKCDTFNGNIVLIPKVIVVKIGNISPQYSKQHGGDFDYGLRAKYAGFETWVAPGIIGECESNSIENSIHDKSLPLKERRKKMKSPQGVPPAKEWMFFAKRHAGFLWPYYWFRTVVRVVFPWSYLLLRKPAE